VTRDDIITVLGKVNPCTGFMYSDKSSQTTNEYGVEWLFMTSYDSTTILRVGLPGLSVGFPRRPASNVRCGESDGLVNRLVSEQANERLQRSSRALVTFIFVSRKSRHVLPHQSF
jgi:hypothetical protein